MIYLRLNEQLINSYTQARWINKLPDRHGDEYAGRSVRGKVVGFLGYGYIARETARLFTAFGCRIIAANTTGTRSIQNANNCVPDGIGDPKAFLPEQMYSSTDESSLACFLSRCDILVSSLPSTPKTRFLLNQKRLLLLPRDAVYVNVGRGDLAKTQDILEALNRSETNGNGPLLGAIMDVTDPEPLSTGSPLFKHPRAIITPHLSGESVNQLAIASNICCHNIKGILTNTDPMNVVNIVDGY